MATYLRYKLPYNGGRANVTTDDGATSITGGVAIVWDTDMVIEKRQIQTAVTKCLEGLAVDLTAEPGNPSRYEVKLDSIQSGALKVDASSDATLTSLYAAGVEFYGTASSKRDVDAYTTATDLLGYITDSAFIPA